MQWISEEFGKLLKLHREGSGLSQLELAEKATVSRASIIAWEKGNNTPSITSLYKIASILNVKPAELLPEEESLVNNPSISAIDEEILQILREG